MTGKARPAGGKRRRSPLGTRGASRWIHGAKSEHQRKIVELLTVMTEADVTLIGQDSLELIPKDPLNAESCNATLDASQDEMQGAGKKSECDYTLYKGDHLSEPLLEDFTYDSEDASENVTLNTLRTSPGDKDSFYAGEWKDSNEEVSSQEESAPPCRLLDKPKESSEVEEVPGPNTAWELMAEEALPARDLLVDTLTVPILEDPLVIMGESLLDCIVKDSPIKEVSSFLTQPTNTLFKRNMHFTDEELLITSNISNMGERTSDQNGNMTDTEQPTESADTGLTISPDALDAHLDNTYTVMQSNRRLKERFRRNVAYCISQEEVMSGSSPPEIVETVSKGEHEAEEKLAPVQAEMARDCKQGDMGDKGSSLSHITRSCYLNHYEASLKLCERNASEFSLKQLLLQEGDMDFCRAISGLGQDQQRQLTRVLDLQRCSVTLEKKIKEIENLQLQEGDLDWDQTIQELEHDQKKQQIQIMDLYYDAISLGAKIKELEVDILNQNGFSDTIAALKRSITDLTAAKNKATAEKDKAESCLKSIEEALASTKGDLQDCEAERSALVLQLKELKADVGTLREKLQEEVGEKTKYMSHCEELDSILHGKEEEIQELSTVKHKLEQKVSGAASALHKTKGEKDSLERHVTSLQATLQRQKEERRAERKKLVCKYNKLVAQIKSLQARSEDEHAEMEKMHQQIHTFRMENGELQQQVAKGKNEIHFLQVESARWKEQYDQIRESQTLKEKMQNQIISILRYKLRLQQEELRKKEEIIAWKMHILGRLHLDMKSVHSDLSTRSLYTEESRFNSPYVQKASNLLSKIRSLLALTEGLLSCQDSKTVADSSKKSETGFKRNEKTKSHSIKKKTIEEKHESTAAMRKLIIKERPSEGHHTGDPVTGQEESPHGSDLLRTKLGEYHKQTDNNWSAFKDRESNLASEEECKAVIEEDKTFQVDFGSLACKASDALQHGTQRNHSLCTGSGWL
ncbi:cancer-associated gene 1 protein isoform X2 [Paroedura picta]|uniref:cancer-associated gene 1 protein isoform X2 n=1 Tax=Paroedura picta TaxID=143630 RepID=UPI0040575750